MTRERFIELINFIKQKREHEDLLCSTLETLCPGEYCNTFIFSDYEEQLVKLIHESLNISPEDDILEWWLYDTSFGTVDDTVEVNGQEISLKSAGDFYDYIKSRQ